MTCAVFDTKPYDRDFLTAAVSGTGVELRFLEFRLGMETVASADGAASVCVFVNDRVDRPVIEALAAKGVRHIALRCAGFNNVDLKAAGATGLSPLMPMSRSPSVR